ncbi:MAG TPA: type II toxin-antitoxin system prevent-host-death family antitoxin [Nocardioides sp.]|uniref:type II toxin-antitoxin system prevent-host-death family antitoxin n=1 Tax=uncultured Nocardioides sp. TaxID=198441 RepID=UPI00260BA625|nr:type II toxin-antitoxin system prevent-host-death family antitoxin [uncultured Nocardioides sp.]HRD59435.1 type II toxin-antitoxin system prevent-host-death family antitoxin [Nocardioides sp.]HRK44805.1 type II toxin-antitoxin system prevent-host-death family antitoxin [Nocardioides sp.]
MTAFADQHPERTMSVTAASGRGVAGLVKDAELGEDIIVERHGRPVAAVISVEHFDELHRVRADLFAAALILARELSDTGSRIDVDDAIAAFGFDRAELEAELDADLAAGRE